MMAWVQDFSVFSRLQASCFICLYAFWNDGNVFKIRRVEFFTRLFNERNFKIAGELKYWKKIGKDKFSTFSRFQASCFTSEIIGDIEIRFSRLHAGCFTPVFNVFKIAGELFYLFYFWNIRLKIEKLVEILSSLRQFSTIFSRLQASCFICFTLLINMKEIR